MSNSFESSGSLKHFRNDELVLDTAGDLGDDPDQRVILNNGFYVENASFFDDLQAGRRPGGGLDTARQSVAVA